MAKNLAISLEYSENSAEIRGGFRLDGAIAATNDPIDDDVDGTWIEIADAEGVTLFRRSLPSASRPRETYDPGGSLHVVEGETRTSSAVVSVPWLGSDARLSLKRGGHVVPSPTFDVAARPVDLLSATLGEIELLIDPSSFAFGADFDFPVAELGLGRSHGGELRLVFLPDGFTADEMPTFHEAVAVFLRDFVVTPPFSDMLEAFSACLIDVPSPVAGIHDPETRDDTARPFFGARFGKKKLRRCIEVDQRQALRVVMALGGRQPHKVGIVIVNTGEYGGSGGDVAVFSLDKRSTAIALHELGHTIFNLADEYADAGQASSSLPIEVNVAAKPYPRSQTWLPDEPTRIKWAASLTPGMTFPGLDTAPPDAVGAFQGAKYEPSLYYRPSATCKMRDLLAPFCPVCRDHIRARLQPHLPA